MVTPASFGLASERVKDDFDKVKRESRMLLQEHGFTAQSAEVEVDILRLSAFNRALDKVMEKLNRKAVQPDFLMVIASHYLWVEACK